ncbi:hypothetical protein ACQEUX_33480 [Micromonospora sp. CA-259024]|uniref:hypothetical protein n=1 Tax=Micromonospora sp. CA-259024 TaxID=3239965 RepID=UPI003D8BB162
MRPHLPTPDGAGVPAELRALGSTSAPIPESLYCRRCRRGVNIRVSDLGVVKYLHAAEQRGHRNQDHDPEPVPVTEISDPIIECDFCSAPDAAWIYRCANQFSEHRRVTTRVVGVSDYRSRHGAARVHRTDTEHAFTQAWGERWSACGGCADLVEARDLYGLIRRVTDSLPAKFTRGKHLMRTRGELHDTYSEVFDTLTPSRGRIAPGHPLGIWPDTTEKTS